MSQINYTIFQNIVSDYRIASLKYYRYTLQTAKKDKSFAERLEQIRKVAAVL